MNEKPLVELSLQLIICYKQFLQ